MRSFAVSTDSSSGQVPATHMGHPGCCSSQHWLSDNCDHSEYKLEDMNILSTFVSTSIPLSPSPSASQIKNSETKQAKSLA